MRVMVKTFAAGAWILTKNAAKAALKYMVDTAIAEFIIWVVKDLFLKNIFKAIDWINVKYGLEPNGYFWKSNYPDVATE